MIETLKNWHAEEMQDAEKYLDAAKDEDMNGHHKTAAILRSIGREEESHAHLLEHLMEHISEN